MILPPLRYLRPDTVAEAVDLLADLDGAIVLAGGQTLINALKLDLVQPAALVDVHRLDELRGVSVAAYGTVTIGAATTYAAIAAAPQLRDGAPRSLRWPPVWSTGRFATAARSAATSASTTPAWRAADRPSVRPTVRSTSPSAAARRPLISHGPYRTDTGNVMLEIRTSGD
jgi:hypothetical protein